MIDKEMELKLLREFYMAVMREWASSGAPQKVVETLKAQDRVQKFYDLYLD